MPLWQGGNQPEYHFGAQLLSWLAPATNGPIETVPIPEPKSDEKLGRENGMTGQSAVLQYLGEARRAIEKHSPARILTLGGDCLVDLPPIAYSGWRRAQMLDAFDNPSILDARSEPYVRKYIPHLFAYEGGHPLRAFGQYLVVMMGRLTHHLPDCHDECVADPLMKKVAHRINENLAWSSPATGDFQRLAIFAHYVVPDDSSAAPASQPSIFPDSHRFQSLRHLHSVAMRAPCRND
jgi:hypothetical protein